MKRKQINKLMNHKITIIVTSIFVFLILLITIGTSYSFKESELDLNGNGSVEVGDVVKLRRFIINDYTKYTVDLNITGGRLLNEKSDNVIAGDTLKFYVVPDDGLMVNSVSCTNNQNATYQNNIVKITNITSNTVCSVTALAPVLKNIVITNATYDSTSVNEKSNVDIITKVDHYTANTGTITNVSLDGNTINVTGTAESYDYLIKSTDATCLQYVCSVGILNDKTCVPNQGTEIGMGGTFICPNGGIVVSCPSGYHPDSIPSFSCPDTTTSTSYSFAYNCVWDGDRPATCNNYECYDGGTLNGSRCNFTEKRYRFSYTIYYY